MVVGWSTFAIGVTGLPQCGWRVPDTEDNLSARKCYLFRPKMLIPDATPANLPNLPCCHARFEPRWPFIHCWCSASMTDTLSEWEDSRGILGLVDQAHLAKTQKDLGRISSAKKRTRGNSANNTSFR